jgi:GcrA cell cycle regulator
MVNFQWTAEKEDDLRRRWKNETARTIAAAYGVTRNTIIGKATRLHLPPKKSSGPRKPYGKRSKPNKTFNTFLNRFFPQSNSTPLPESAPEEIDPHFRCTLLDLTDKSCRWPLWGNYTQPYDERWFCGMPVAIAAGMPYCPIHSEKALA